MRFLHLLSQTHLTGAEVYAAEICREPLALGDQCWIMSDTLTAHVPGVEYIPLSLHDRRYLSRWGNINQVVRCCRHNHIDVIHAHSRAVSWLANIASRKAGVGYVSTVHGRQKVHSSSRRMNMMPSDQGLQFWKKPVVGI